MKNLLITAVLSLLVTILVTNKALDGQSVTGQVSGTTVDSTRKDGANGKFLEEKSLASRWFFDIGP